MVKKRVSVDSDTKMPVEKRVLKRIRQPEEESPLSVPDKEQRGMSNGKSKVDQELRSVALDSGRAKAATDNDEYHEVRSIRSGRKIIRPRQYNLCSQTEDDGEEEYVKKRPARMNHNRVAKRGDAAAANRITITSRRKARLTASSCREALNGTLPRRNLRPGKKHQSTAEKNLSSIRRSTRQRKLKYENYSDSWIVGAQALIGYPMYDNSYSSKGRKIKGGVVYDDEEEESNSVEEEEEEEEEEESEEAEENANEVNGEETKVKPEEANNEKTAVNGEEAPEEGGLVTRLRRSCRENPKPKAGNSAAFDDMNTRGKRTRAQRETNGSAAKPKKGRKGKRGNSSSEESNSERGYSLRKTRCQVKRLNLAAGPTRIRRVLSPRRPRRRRRGDSSDSSESPPSSSSDSDGDVNKYDRKKSKKSIYNQLLPTTASGVSKSGRLADVDPIKIDSSISFKDVGGLEGHVRCLQEMVVFPMLYNDVFSKFQITVPKGVLFHGPPGTGKTLIARALANECSSGERKVSFFMRKGADCLTKWVGESERQLKLLFKAAKQLRPSIIFFDEIDGLAPVRSSKQDQIHASIVSTLLALMDGLDDRGEVVVIGATNRLDAIDPALRRPGRFDRELLFPLPASQERREILKIHTSKWECKPSDEEIAKMADMSVGYCGSDLRAFCSEAVIFALGRLYPQIYKSNRKLQINPDTVKVEWSDFEEAFREIVPASQRSAPAVARNLPVFLAPLFVRPLTELTAHLRVTFPSGFCKSSRGLQVVKSPRLLIIGQNKQTNLLSSALLYTMEQVPVHVLDLAAFYSQSQRLPEEACIQIFNQVRQTVPSILYLPGVDTWWDTVSTTVQAVFLSMLNQLDPCLPILLLATAQNQLPNQLEQFFSVYRNEIYRVPALTTDAEREAFFRPLIVVRALRPKPTPKPVVQEEELPFAPTPPPPKLTSVEMRTIKRNEEDTQRTLRRYLRTVCASISRQKAFELFCKPVDIEEVPDYPTIIKKPMHMDQIVAKINDHEYETVQDFLEDINLIVSNALEYNPIKTANDKAIRMQACHLHDTAYAITRQFIDLEFEILCAQVKEARLQRETSPDRAYVPCNYDQFLTKQLRPSALLKANAAFYSNDDAGEDNDKANEETSPAAKNNAKANNSATATVVTPRKRKNFWSRGHIKKQSNRTNVNNQDSSHSSCGNSSSKQEKSKTEPNSNKKVAQTSAAETPANNVTANSVTSSASQASTSGKQSKKTTPIEHSTPVKRAKRTAESEDRAVPGTSHTAMNGVIHSDDEMLIDEEGTKDRSNSNENQTKKKGNEYVNLDDSFNVATTETAFENDVEASDNIVQVSRPALERILQDIVRVTQGVSSIELILDLYAQLRCVINKHLDTNIRHGLPA
ncbi:hypothetical protein LSTR_LSTR011497, partial [Laodelphax striatellus]